MRSVWIVVALLAFVPACGAGTIDLHGHVALKRLLSKPDGDGGCMGLRSYGDLSAGRQVSVFDDSGTQVATGSLGQGMYSDNQCVFPITVLGVPNRSDRYTVAVGGRRGDQARLTYSAAEVNNGTVTVTIG